MSRLPSIAALFLAVPCAAQLDLGSHGVPQDEIDAYMAPFYRLVAAGLGAGRHLPAGTGPGWHIGLQGAVVPIPGGEPFDDADVSALPLLRVEGGGRLGGIGAAARGMVYTDPRIGELSTWGVGLSLGRSLPAPLLPGGAATLALVLGWDRLDFASEYVYEYEGPVGLFEGEVEGDYTLSEDLLAAGLQAGARRGGWTFTAEALLERVGGRFRYLYVDPRMAPRDGEPSQVSSRLSHAGFRAALGLGWRGLRLYAGWRSHPYLGVGWAWDPWSRGP
jgi:hypothetical protein